uniref:Uncharacterized protein n=1 Tax=uncultured marine group II/III euryarchaeote KM3_87_G01 TaxID=1456533 RepID=A0A075I181_9EURY|nr:hypothetical protein [uncultured marine group II/III euryarchaeote KM3_87_G01]
MEIATFDTERFRKDGEIFSREIHDNERILFHGTTSICEENILNNGLTSNLSDNSILSTITSIIEQFEKMAWAGDDAGGFLVLKYYSKESDYRKSGKKPIFFKHELSTACLYATIDFAGGESSRAIRKSLSDLEKYCNNDELRSEHLQKLWRKLVKNSSWLEVLPRKFRKTNAKNVTPEIYSEVWDFMKNNWPTMLEQWPPCSHQLPPHLPKIEPIQKFLNQMKEVNVKANYPIINYQYGVIFAIKMNNEDFHTLENWGEQGIVSFQSIGPEKIVGICRTDEISYALWEEVKMSTVVNNRHQDRIRNQIKLYQKTQSQK